MLTWEAPPELGALWTDFQIERAKLMADKDKFDKAQKKRMNEKRYNLKLIEKNSSLNLQFVLQSWFLPLPASD